mmetsp:Transcript_53796/g.99444  ORF Transcript_53796/g.99444 Transcript_53796/m.99444 type:complete len:485 (+) Transcript_53796:58-1512(+)
MPAEPNSRRVITQSCASGSDVPGVGDPEKLHDGDVEHCSDVELAVLQEINALQSEMDATKREIMEKEATLLRWQGTVPGMQHVDRIRPGRVARAPPTLEESALGAIIEDSIEEVEASLDSVEAKVTASPEPDKALAKESEAEIEQNRAENELSEADNKPLEAALAISLKEKVQDAIDKVRSHLAQFNKETAEMTTLSSPTFSTGSGASKATDLGTPSSVASGGPTTLFMARPGSSVRMSSAGICYTTTRAAPAVVCDGQDLTDSQPHLVLQPSASCRSSSVTLMGPRRVQRQSSSPAHPTVLIRDSSLRRSSSTKQDFRPRSARDQVGRHSQTPGPPMRPGETPRMSPRAIIVPARTPIRRERSVKQPRLGGPPADEQAAGARAAQMSVRRLRVEPSRPEVSSVASSMPLAASIAPSAPPRPVQVVSGLLHQQRSSIAVTPGQACTVRRLASPRPVERIEVADHRAAPLRTLSVVSSVAAPIVA